MFLSEEHAARLFLRHANRPDPWEIWWSGSGAQDPGGTSPSSQVRRLVFAPDPIHSLVAADGSQHVIIAGPRTARVRSV